jgi:nitrate/TMAO reductase-like tetraheme cytochrome c subunit
MRKRKLTILGASLGAAAIIFVAGIVFWGGFNTAMEVTNTMPFCISCHEMKDNVYEEYKKTVHYSNRSGVRAVCSDCHVPDPWVHKVVRKIQASREVYHKILGTVDAPEKFDAKRMQLAGNVWTTMKRTDSRECRNCHDFASMSEDAQKRRAWRQHMSAQEEGKTCIDCHQGIAHKLPDDWEPIYDAVAEGVPVRKALAGIAAPGASPQPAAVTRVAAPADPAPAPAAPAEPVPAPAEPAPAGAAAADAPALPALDWSAVPEQEIVLFYPGQASMEWVLERPHGGARAFKSGDRCFDCHDGEQGDIGALIVSGDKEELTPIPGKRGSIPLTVRAAHDGANLYMQFRWPDGAHAPAPFVAGGKMDPDHPIKLAIILDDNKAQYADQAGCWGSCHHDSRDMPHAPEAAVLAQHPAAQRLDVTSGVTKYLAESRTEIETRGRDGAPRGGWDKLKDDAELDALKQSGVFLDVLRYKSGQGGKSEGGYILAERVMETSVPGMVFDGVLENGFWTVTLARQLDTGHPTDVKLATDKLYNIGFAIHDDYAVGRFHHVSLGYILGFDNADAEINAVKQ